MSMALDELEDESRDEQVFSTEKEEGLLGAVESTLAAFAERYSLQRQDSSPLTKKYHYRNGSPTRYAQLEVFPLAKGNGLMIKGALYLSSNSPPRPIPSRIESSDTLERGLEEMFRKVHREYVSVI